jgi:hypothetical protein
VTDREGRWAALPVFANVGAAFSGPFPGGGLAPAASRDGQWGFIDPRGRWAVEPAFAAVYPFFENGMTAAMGPGGLWGIIDGSGAWAATPRFGEVALFPPPACPRGGPDGP